MVLDIWFTYLIYKTNTWTERECFYSEDKIDNWTERESFYSEDKIVPCDTILQSFCGISNAP